MSIGTNGDRGRSPSEGARPRVVIVTRHWGDGEVDNEATTATRLVAGALARSTEVDVVHIVSPPEPISRSTDSVFGVIRVPLRGARTLRAGIIRAALASNDGGAHIPGAAASLLNRYEGEAPDVLEVLEQLDPQTIVLAGHHQPFDVDALKMLGGRRRRVVFLPFLDDPRRLDATGVQQVLEVADAIGVTNAGEARAVAAACPLRDPREIVPFDLAFGVNRSAANQRLFGVRFFGRYVLLIRSFPPDAPRFERSVTHEVLRNVIGHISVAEVDDGHWRISDKDNTLELPVNPTRVNLWRLMSHALMTIDVRPPGPVGREALESMLLGTPVLVPEPSAAMEHAAAANGGLWYRDAGSLFDAARALMSPTLRRKLGAQARAHTEAHHGQMDDFVRRSAKLALGRRNRRVYLASAASDSRSSVAMPSKISSSEWTSRS